MKGTLSGLVAANSDGERLCPQGFCVSVEASGDDAIDLDWSEAEETSKGKVAQALVSLWRGEQQMDHAGRLHSAILKPEPFPSQICPGHVTSRHAFLSYHPPAARGDDSDRALTRLLRLPR